MSFRSILLEYWSTTIITTTTTTTVIRQIYILNWKCCTGVLNLLSSTRRLQTVGHDGTTVLHFHHKNHDGIQATGRDSLLGSYCQLEIRTYPWELNVDASRGSDYAGTTLGWWAIGAAGATTSICLAGRSYRCSLVHRNKNCDSIAIQS